MDAAENTRYVTNYTSYIHKFSLGTLSYKSSTNIWWKFWSLYQAMNTTFSCMVSASFLITEETIRIEDKISITATMYSSISLLIMQYMTYKFNENWNNLKNILDQDFVNSLHINGDLGRIEKVEKLKPLFEQKRIWWMYVGTGGSILLALGVFLWQCFGKDVDFHDPSNYLLLFPGAYGVNTRLTYISICLFQSIIVAGIGLPIGATWLLISVIVVEIMNKAVVLQEAMKLITDDVHHTIVFIRENEMKIDNTKSPRLKKLINEKAQNDKEICFQKFEENLKICVKHHQTLRRAIKYLQPLLNNFFTVNLGICVIMMIHSGFFIMIPDKKFEFGIIVLKFFVILSSTFLQVGIQCLVAQYIQNTMEMLAEQVYSLPWYELSPPRRKNVYIFLCQAQASLNFYAFKTFHISTYFFPKILDFVYTNTMNTYAIVYVQRAANGRVVYLTNFRVIKFLKSTLCLHQIYLVPYCEVMKGLVSSYIYRLMKIS